MSRLVCMRRRQAGIQQTQSLMSLSESSSSTSGCVMDPMRGTTATARNGPRVEGLFGLRRHFARRLASSNSTDLAPFSGAVGSLGRVLLDELLQIQTICSGTLTLMDRFYVDERDGCRDRPRGG